VVGKCQDLPVKYTTSDLHIHASATLSQGLSTVNLQIERLQAEAQAFGAESQGVMRCVKFTMQPDQLTPGTEHRNRINLVGQLRQPDGRSMLSQASPGTGHFGSQPMYQ